MFKFRRPSICSSKEIFTPEGDSVGGDVSSVGSSSSCPAPSVDLLINNIKGDSSVKKSGTDSSSRSTRSEEKESTEPTRDSVSVNNGRTNNNNNNGGKESPTIMTKWTFNGEKLKANFKKSFIGQVMCDRKRKERHESVSRGQEKKVIRSLSDDEGLGINEAEKAKDFKRTLSHDNFNRNKCENEFDGRLRNNNGKFIENEPMNTDHSVKKEMTKPEGQEQPVVVLSDVPLANMMRTFAGSYEPELQRQLERSVNYNFPTTSKGSTGRRTHHRRHHRSSSRHDSDNSGPSSSSVIEDSKKVEDSQEEVASSLTESSSSSDSTEDTNVPNAIPSVRIQEDSARKEDFELDFTKMHHEVETSQPKSFLESIRAPGGDDQVMLSPRSGIHIKGTIDLPPSPPMMQIQLDPPLSRQSLLGENESTKINSLTRQITNMKKNVKILEEDYEQIYGYKPSHADKLNNREMRKALVQLAKAKRDLKDLKEDPSAVQEANLLSVVRITYPLNFQRGSVEFLKSLDDTVKEIQKSLEQKRKKVGRPDDPEKMSNSELTEEKSIMQRQLLVLEKRHGRPSSKQEKDIVRPLYDRYRAVKKFSVRTVSMLKESVVADLVPIMEHETLEFPEIEDDGNSPSCSVVEIKRDFNESPKLKHSRVQELEMELDDADRTIDATGNNEAFNEMNLYELEKRQKQIKEEKRKLRGFLRRFESDFQEATGRPPLKEEKYSSADMESYYQKYKRTRATVRLLEVLINKKRFPQLLVDLNKNED